MALKAANEDSVLILLSAKSPNNVTYPERRILLTQSQPRLKIGRSSNRSSMGLTPTLDNGYFDSPVMSREHAEIEADMAGQVVRIRDAGSMHGTVLNDEPLETEVARPLVSGDEVTFGSSVYRNQKTFKPATVTVGIEFQTPGQADHSPSRVFTVPDDCSTDENEPLDDNAPLKIPTFSSQEINQWKMERRDAVRQVDGIIEIDSSSESDSDVLSSDDGHDAVESGDMEAEIDDDESISLTDDEETSSAPASPLESIDLDDIGLTDNVGDLYNAGARSPSWNSVSSDPYSEHAEVQPPSGHNSEDEQGVFLYDTESEETDEIDHMDMIDPIDVDFAPCPQPAVHPSHHLPAQTTLPPLPVVSFTLPSINTAVLSQQEVPQFNCRLAPVMVTQPAPRQPSPSDAVLPVARRHHGSEDDCGVTVESLGLKSGKPDFFEAREQNKITVAHSRNHYAPDANPFLTSSDTAKTDKDALRPVTEDVVQYPASSGTEFELASAPAFDKEAHTVVMPQVPQPLTGRMTSQGIGRLSRSSHEPIPLAPEEALSTSPLRETSEMDIEPQEPVDPAWTAASAPELSVKQQRNVMQAHMEAACALAMVRAKQSMAAKRLETPKDTSKVKRKAVDISEATNQELVWHGQSASDKQSEPSSPAPVQPEIEMDLSTLSFHDTPEQGSTAVRPTKMRKIAERVGYAALGGATVGAMVLTSLIYTAPNFA